jgi:hypothetical protein
MSNLTTQVFGDMNYLYEHIANRDAQQLNENSEHYDEEGTELVADILATISSSMVYEGYSANAIITFLTTSSEQDIVEKYLSFDENIITESTVSEDYIVEQLEIFDFAINEGLVGGAINLLGRIASKPARMRVDKILSGAKNPERARELLQKTAQKSARNANVGGYSSTMSPVGGGNLTGKQSAELLTKAKLGQGVQKVKDIAKGAKAALTSPTAKKIGLGALGAGALVGLPYAGAKLAGAGSGGQGPSPAGGKPGTPGSSSNTDFMKGSALAKLGGRQGRVKDGEFRTMGWSKQSADRYNKAKGATTPPAAAKPPVPAKPVASSSGGGSGSGGGSKPAAKKPFIGTTKDGTKFERRTPTSKELAASKAAGGGEAGVRAAVAAGKPTTGPEASNAQKSQAGADVAAIQAKERANFEKKNKEVMASTQKESYNAYELVLEYLFDYGHANTIEEAEYIMTELDESFIQSLVETYEANVLAEEVTEWVNELVEEGHDLSEYTWDDMVDHYFSEAKVDKVVDKELANAGVGSGTRMSVKKSSRNARKKSESRMTPTQLKLADKRSDAAGRKQDSEREISGTRRGPESSTEY